MSRITLSDKTLTIDISRMLKNRRVDFKAMTEEQKLEYALSCVGIKQDRLSVKRHEAIQKAPFAIDSKISKRSENFFLNLLRDNCKIGHHAPLENIKYFGVEIECLIPFDSLNVDKNDFSSDSGGMRECGDCGGSGEVTYIHRDSGSEMEGTCPTCDGDGEYESDDCDDSNSDLFQECKYKLGQKIKALNIKGIDIKEDGSLDAEGDDDILWPVEITCLVKQNDMSSLEKLCKLLNELGAKVNSTCGLHVHMDARHLSKNQVSRLGTKLGLALPFLGKMVPKSRLKSRFCKMMVSDFAHDRYCAVNLTAFQKYKTIEIRLHSSTTSFVKISNWIKILGLICNARPSRLESMNTVSEFFEAIRADEDLQNYVISRIAKFKGNSEETPCEAEVETADESQTEMVA